MAQNIKGHYYNVEPLNGNNYESWSFRVKTILIENDVEEMIRIKYVRETYADDATREQARKKDNRCKTIIVQCIDDTQIDIIRDKETSYEMWKSIQEMYERRGLSGQLLLRRKLMSLKMEETDKLDDFILNFDHTLSQLKSSGAEISDQDTVCTLLLALPRSYETVVTVLENLPAESINMDFVKMRLKTKAEKRSGKMNQGENMKSTAFTANKRSVCHNCGEQGYFKRDCKKLNYERSSNQGGIYQRDIHRNDASRNGSYRGNKGRGTGFQPRNQGDGQQGINQYRGQHQTNQYRGQHQTNQHRGWNQAPRYQAPRQGENRFARKGYYAGVDEIEEERISFMSEKRELIENVGSDIIKFSIDSGCTDHLVNKREYFNNLMLLDNSIEIAIAKNNSYIEATAIGSIEVISCIKGKEFKCTINNALYVPYLRKNLLSVKRLGMCGIKVIFEGEEVKLMKNETEIGIGFRNNLYEINFKVTKNECLNVETEDKIVKLWHKRYGHISYANLKKLIEHNMVNGIDMLNIGNVEFCESCVNAKITRVPFKTRTKSKSILEIIHSDVCGPIDPCSYDGGNYFATFIDDYSGFIYTYIIKRKSEVYNCFREYAKLVQTKFNKRIGNLRCDNGGEYRSGELIAYCRENGTFIDYTTPYTPQLNEKAERFNRSLVEKDRSMISDSRMPKKFWGEAILTATYILNRSPSASLDFITPAEIWFGKKASVENLRIFGTMAYAHVPEQFRSKFDDKCERCIMLGHTKVVFRIGH